MKAEESRALIRWYILGAVGGPDGRRRLAAGVCPPAGHGHRHVQPGLLPVRCAYGLWRPVAIVGLGAVGCFLYYFMVKALNTDIDARCQKAKTVQFLCGIFTVAVALAFHTWSATLAWFTAYLGPRIGAEAALAAVTAYQNDLLAAILPLYLPMVLTIGIHFVLLLTGRTRYPRWLLAFHPVVWNILLAGIPDLAQALQVPVATWMAVMSQSSTNSSIVLWCLATAVYTHKHPQTA